MNPVKQSSVEFSAPQKIFRALESLYCPSRSLISHLRLVRNNRRLNLKSSQRHIHSNLILPKRFSLLFLIPFNSQWPYIAQERGASNWLTALPISEFGFALHKGAFRDALCLWYGWQPAWAPEMCNCGHQFSISIMPYGWDEIRDLTANLLSEVCNNDTIEPHLQPVSGIWSHRNLQDGACLDVAACGLWGGCYERTYPDIRIFNLLAPSNWHGNPFCYCKHKNQRVWAKDPGDWSCLLTNYCAVMHWRPWAHCNIYLQIHSLPPCRQMG